MMTVATTPTMMEGTRVAVRVFFSCPSLATLDVPLTSSPEVGMFMPDSTSHDRNSGFYVLVVKPRPVSMVAAGELVAQAGRRTIGEAVLLRAKVPFHRFCSLKYTRPRAWRRARPLCLWSRRGRRRTWLVPGDGQ